MPEEIIDLVNEDDQVIGQIGREELHKQNLHNYRAVHAFLKNKEGKIWIPKRTAHKKLAPNALDFSVAGHVTSGMTYEEALKMELSEGLNIDLDQVSWRTLGKFTPSENGTNCYQMIYEIKFDETPNFNPDDFSEGTWFTPFEALEHIKAGALAKADVAPTIEAFYCTQKVCCQGRCSM